MALKVGQSTTFYNVKTKKKESAKITKIISKRKGARRAMAKGKSGTKLNKFIK